MGPLEERARASGYGVFNLRNMLTLWGPGKFNINIAKSSLIESFDQYIFFS